jgi:hypothetical protein
MPTDDKDSGQFDELLLQVQKRVPGEAQKRARELAKTLGRIFSWLRYSKLMVGTNVYLNEAVLIHVCSAFYADLFRLEAFHPARPADTHKQAAHIFKWISRLRPVYPEAQNPQKLKGLAVTANGIFAIYCALSFLDMEPFVPTASEREHMLYSSTYRDIHPQEWAMMFYLLEKLHKK